MPIPTGTQVRLDSSYVKHGATTGTIEKHLPSRIPYDYAVRVEGHDTLTWYFEDEVSPLPNQ